MKWYAIAAIQVRINDIDLTAHEPEFSSFQWVSLDDLPGLIVPFKRQVYEQVLAEFRHLGT